MLTYSVKHEAVLPPPVSLRSACLPPLALRKETKVVNTSTLFFQVILDSVYLSQGYQIPSHSPGVFHCYRYRDICGLKCVNYFRRINRICLTTNHRKLICSFHLQDQ